jgi:hypothetical protein
LEDDRGSGVVAADYKTGKPFAFGKTAAVRQN